MIALNDVNVQEELENKTDNRTVSYKHRTERTLLIKLNNGTCTIIPYLLFHYSIL